MIQFLWGAVATLCLVAGTFFLRFWRRTSDRFFLLFAIAFYSFAGTWTGLALVTAANEAKNLFYLMRLFTFLLIIAAIIDKNRRTDL